MVAPLRFELRTPSASTTCSTSWARVPYGWIAGGRTQNRRINSAVLYHWATIHYWSDRGELNSPSSSPQDDVITVTLLLGYGVHNGNWTRATTVTGWRVNRYTIWTYWWSREDSNLYAFRFTDGQEHPVRYNIFGQGGESWTHDWRLQSSYVTVTLHQDIKNPDLFCLAGVSRFELDLVVLETTVQPLHYTPRLVIRVILIKLWLPEFVHGSTFYWFATPSFTFRLAL